jgi:hypothetical protein
MRVSNVGLRDFRRITLRGKATVEVFMESRRVPLRRARAWPRGPTGRFCARRAGRGAMIACGDGALGQGEA